MDLFSISNLPWSSTTTYKYYSNTVFVCNISDYLYSGRTNDLVVIREWSLVILCHYDLTNYPFDTQRCPLSLRLAKYTSDLFVVRLDNYTFSGNPRHHQYELRHISLHNFTLNGYAGQRLMLVLRNQYIYYISAAYVPSGMLLVISYLTYYFNMEDFQTRITVALTSLLVLATLFSELVGGLPKTSYLKLIDVWFLGCIVANFCMVVCLVLIEKQKSWFGGGREGERGREGRGREGVRGKGEGAIVVVPTSPKPSSNRGLPKIFFGEESLLQPPSTPSPVLMVKEAEDISVHKIQPVISGSAENSLLNSNFEHKNKMNEDSWQVSKFCLNSVMKVLIPIVIFVFIVAYVSVVYIALDS